MRLYYFNVKWQYKSYNAKYIDIRVVATVSNYSEDIHITMHNNDVLAIHISTIRNMLFNASLLLFNFTSTM